MDVIFATQELLDAYDNISVGRRLWGADVAAKYIQRVDTPYAVGSGADLYRLQALRFHALKGSREGQHAIRLDRAWRLIVTFDDEQMRIVRVEEVTRHYGD